MAQFVAGRSSLGEWRSSSLVARRSGNGYSTYHLLRSLAYFDDADREPEPMLTEPLAWNEVKEFFRRAQREMMRGYEPK